MKKWIATLIMVVLIYVLETTFFRSIAIFNTIPNLMIVLLVAFAYRYGNIDGIILGFIIGIFLDILEGNYIGITSIILMIIGYLVGFAKKIYDKNDYTISLLLIGISDFVYSFLVYITGYLLRNRTNVMFYMRTIILPELLFTLVAGAVIYKLLVLLYNTLDKKRVKKEEV